MTFPKFTLAFCTVALAVASAATYHVTISDREWVGDKEIMPGDYAIQVEGDKAVIRNGRDVTTVNHQIPVVRTEVSTVDSMAI